MTANTQTFQFDNSATCTSSNSQFFCVQPGGSNASMLNGCEDITMETTVSYSYSWRTIDTSTLSTAYIPTATSCAMWKGSVVCATYFSTSLSSIPTTIADSSLVTFKVTQPMAMISTLYTEFMTITEYYAKRRIVSGISIFTWVQTEYVYTSADVDGQKLSWYDVTYIHHFLRSNNSIATLETASHARPSK